MSDATRYTPELGQMVWGNPSGEFAIPDYAEAMIRGLLDEVGRVYWNRTQQGWEHYKPDTQQVVSTIQYHPYYWGDCTCGFDAKDDAWGEAHHHTSECFFTRYHAEANQRPAGDMAWHEHMIEWSKTNGYPDAPYGMAAHCDCGHDTAYIEWRETHDHSPTCPTVLPNFAFDGVEVRWYKYPMRGASCNRQLSPEKWAEWYSQCLAAIQSCDIDEIEPS